MRVEVVKSSPGASHTTMFSRILVGLLLIGCGDDARRSVDSGVVDALIDTAIDAVADTTVDAQPDGMIDGSPADASVDATADAGPDASTCGDPTALGDWTALDDVSRVEGETAAVHPSFAVDSLDRIVLAHDERELTPGAGVYVQRWQDGAWQPLGLNLRADPTGFETDWPSVAVDEDDRPVVAWQERTPSLVRNIHVWRFEAGAWAPMGGPLRASAGDTSADNAHLAAGPGGELVVAWHESDGTGTADIHVFEWTGTNWSPLGGGLSAVPGVTRAIRARLAIDAHGTVFVAWAEIDAADRFDVYVRRWTGSSWEALGGPLSAVPSSTGALHPDLVLDMEGNPVVAWVEGTTAGIYARRWDGAAWVDLGNVSAGLPETTGGLPPVVGINAAGEILVGFTIRNALGGLYVRRWTGTMWVPLGPRVSTDGANGIGGTYTACGDPIVAWNFPGDSELHVARFER